MSAPVIAGFTFVEHLGSGGFADVFLYEQDWPRQRVAVKVVRPDVPLDDREKNLFAAEANAMARLADHPYIVSVITAGITHDSGRPFLVMRYCPPPDLGVRVRSHPMAPIDAISTGIKLSSAIETAHRSGILHRDIKPSNVLVTTYHEPALTDFGIAGQIQDVAGDSEVRISYPWSPPEMLDGRSNGSVQSDVYSLGATIWHLLVGRSPFSIPNGDNSTRALSARILHAAPPATQRPDVPPALDRLLQQCLAKNPAHRPQTALDLARALQRIEADAGFPRTAVAVEGDRADAAVAAPRPDVEDDHTVMKAVTVISASGPRAVAPAPQQPDGATGDEQPASRAGIVWAVVAVVALVAVVAGLLTRGGDPSDDPEPGPTSPSTPLELLPTSLDQAPVLTARRTPRGVRFAWTSPDEEPGDEWVWQRLDTEEFGRTSKRSLLVRNADEVCLEVRLRRDGDDSPVDQACA